MKPEICQGCGCAVDYPASGLRYCNIENGLTVLYLCDRCAATVQDLMGQVLAIVKTPYAHFRNFISTDAKPNMRTRPEEA